MRCAVLLAWVVLLVPLSPARADRWQPIAVEGEFSPAGRAYGDLRLALRIADDGSVSFHDVPVDPLPASSSYTVWRWSEESGAEVVVTIQVDVGNEGWRAPELLANPAGDLAWRDGRLPSPVACGEGQMSTQARERLLLLPRGGALLLVAETGTPSPGDPDAIWARLLRPAFGIPPPISLLRPTLLLGHDADLSFRAELAADPCFLDDGTAVLTRALFAPDATGELARIAQEDEPLPGATSGETLRLEDLSLATDGLGVWLALAGFDAPDAAAILRWDAPAGVLDTVVRTDQPSPWLGGARIESVGEPRASPGGVVALHGVRDASEPFPLGGRNGIWVGDAAGLEEAVILAGSVPGSAPESAFVPRRFASGSLHVNDAGEVAFGALFVASPGEDLRIGLFGPGPDGDPTLQLAVGDPAPGVPPLTILGLDPVHLSPTGDVLALALLGDRPFAISSRGWILLPRGGAPRLLLQNPAELEVAPGDVRSLDVAEFAYDDALLHFAARFEGLFESDVLAVRAAPEPGVPTAGTCALAALAGLASRRRVRPRRTGSEPFGCARERAPTAMRATDSRDETAGGQRPVRSCTRAPGSRISSLRFSAWIAREEDDPCIR